MHCDDGNDAMYDNHIMKDDDDDGGGIQNHCAKLLICVKYTFIIILRENDRLYFLKGA